MLKISDEDGNTIEEYIIKQQNIQYNICIKPLNEKIELLEQAFENHTTIISQLKDLILQLQQSQINTNDTLLKRLGNLFSKRNIKKINVDLEGE
jgi:hypothetical protein